MKKRQLIATLACLMVGMAGFAGAYSIEQTEQNQTQQQAEVPTTEISQVSGVIEPETDNDSDGLNDSEEGAKSSSGTDGDTQTVSLASSDGVSGGEDGKDENGSEIAATSADADNTDVVGETDADEASEAAAANADTVDGDEIVEPDNSTDENAETVNADAIQFTADLRWPLESGSVILNYSMDHMVYFETLEQYQYNPAMIISAEVGDKVYVVAEGMITDISTNEVTGLTVTEDLGDGYTAIYGQLSDVNFAVGDTVERGHVLGYVAETTKYYSVEGTNLYFAMELNGESINPLEYFAD
ncbi:MAG: peptidoglycan DD-metalloendopeptidase family protein [Clostridiales bacterium]|nr:peptidoglycan DD-metalloendopeptidase family protein [Clostridiales bacterium]